MRPKSYTSSGKRCFSCKHCKDAFTSRGYALLCLLGDKSKKVSEEEGEKYFQDRTVDVVGYCPKYEDTTL